MIPRLLLFATLLPVLSVTAEPFAFRESDTVALVGDTFLERAQSYGYLETELLLASPARGLKFRNLAWSGDTPEGDARSYFGPPSEGLERLHAVLSELKPQVVMLSYGAMEAFEGPENLQSFLESYEKLLDLVRSAAPAREIVIFAPPPAENLGAPLPDLTTYNRNLALYRDALRDMAQRQGLHFVDLFGRVQALPGSDRPGHLTENGIHYTANGYAALAPLVVSELGLTPASVSNPYKDELRQVVIAKNRLFFHRWRPANETYLRLFRKHEQGQNAAELPLFDPLVQARELEIQSLLDLLALRQTES